VVTSLLEMLNTSPSGDRRQEKPAFEWEPLSQRILNQVMSVFLSEFSDVLMQSRPPGERFTQGLLDSDIDLERRIASVPGLMIALFKHIKESKSSKKKQKKVRFSSVEEISVNNDQ
jgi:hypothetical protein